MEPKDYLLWYAALELELSALRDQRTELEVQLQEVNKKIDHIQHTMQHLSPLTGMAQSDFDDIKELGITDAVRSVLDRRVRMSAAEVKAKMEERGFDFSKYSAPDASVRTVLKRLVEAKKAEPEKEGYKIFYKYLPTDDEIPF